MNVSKIKKIVVVLIVFVFALAVTACDSNGIEDELGDGNGEEDQLIRETVNDVDGLASILEELEAEDEVLIEFKDGEYEENIAINDNYEFAELNLIAENKHEAILKQQQNERGIEIMDSSNITISGFKIIGDNENLDEKVGVGIFRSDNITIKDNHVKDFPYQGIYADDSQAHIENNIIENNDHGGIKILNSIEESTINKNNIIDNDSSGINIDNSEVTINDNTISRNEQRGIIVSESKAEIKDNDIKDSSEGIFLEQPEEDIQEKDASITGNYFDLLESGLTNIKYYYISFSPNYAGDLITVKDANEYNQSKENVQIYDSTENPDLIGVPEN